ncbi:uncharacterized protein DDB_G0292186-like [Galleria mellonella]|uniref:Uncharacterized protein DDB_G0292186-like n=1 Tax=Galleria mellonella TaxID=7137 RepID=A0A6J1W8L4_GALME|nr:uncharacterized protein DDB_G0292186-like [Galleria mellonella]
MSKSDSMTFIIFIFFDFKISTFYFTKLLMKTILLHMEKQKENSFNKKFRLLCSQTSSEEINWSSSDSGEYENVVHSYDKIMNLSHKTTKRKRKKKVPKNIFNLDINYIIGESDHKSDLNTHNKCPSKSETNHANLSTSPILMAKHNCKSYKYNVKLSNSPIICQKSLNQLTNIQKSPILMLKSMSPKYSPKVKKKLFNNNESVSKSISKQNSISKCDNNENNNDLNLISDQNSKCIHHEIFKKNKRDVQDICNKKKVNPIMEDGLVFNNATNTKSEETISNYNLVDNKQIMINEKDEEKESFMSGNIDESISFLKADNLDLNLVKKVKTYFDGHFSSENASQHSISDILTPKNSSKSSEDIEIISTVTQVNSHKNSSETLKEETINDCIISNNNTSKKMRYKKDGLAYRLNALLKKHNASVSLWYHERFLAANSNFVIPKGEHVVFQIRNVQFNYGCYILDVRSIENNNFLVLINNNYVNDHSISKDMILKVYEPYSILDLNAVYKIVVNVCKFECIINN